jgi:predicted transposase YdaD
MGKADLSGKRTITIYAQAWLQWALQEEEVTVQGELSGEFQFATRTADSLLQVQGRTGQFLALTELQLRHDPEMPERLAAYAALARQKYHRPVYVTVVNLRPPPSTATPGKAFHQEFMGQMAHQDFQVIALWELDAKQILAMDNPALLPFVPLMRGGNTKEMVVACAERIRQEQDPELETVLAAFASYVLSADVINQVLRWEMTFLKESSIIKEFLTQEHILGFEEGRQEGRLEGRQEGRLEGRQEGRLAALVFLRRLLAYRFGLPLDYFDRHLYQLDLETLKQLGDIAFDAESLAAFNEALERAESEAKGRVETPPEPRP